MSLPTLADKSIQGVWDALGGQLDLSPRLADFVLDRIVSGLTLPTSADLTSTLAAGVAWVIGTRVVKAATALTFAASSDTYVDLGKDGTLTLAAVANGTAAPAVTANSLRLLKAVTSATAVTGVTNLARMALRTTPQDVVEIGDANALIKRVGSDTNIENLVASSRMASANQSQLVQNATYDGTAWNRVAVDAPASLFAATRTGDIQLYTVPAGANPIAWSGPFAVAHTGIGLQYAKAIQLAASTDLNTLTTPGFYDGNQLVNAPLGSADWFYIEVQTHSNGPGYCKQIARGLASDSISWQYERSSGGGTWGQWLGIVKQTATGIIDSEAYIAPTLLNGWVNYGVGGATVGFFKDKFGIVHIKGLVKSGTTSTATVIFNLPGGYRPLEDQQFATVSEGVFGDGRVMAGGDVVFDHGTNVWFSLNNISFRAEQ